MLPGLLPFEDSKPDFGAELDLDHPLCQGLILAAFFNEAGGPNALNLADQKTRGTLNGPAVFAPTKFGSSGINFPGGSRGYVSFGSSVGSTLQAHSFLTWINLTSNAAQSEFPLINRENITSDGWEWTVNNPSGGDGLATARFNVGYAYFDGAVRGFYNSTGNLTTGSWYQVGGVWRQSDGFVDFYINGRLDSSVATTTGTITNAGGTNLLTGSRSLSGFQNFAYMREDHIMLWNRALKAEDFAQLYTQPFQMLQQPMVRRYFSLGGTLYTQTLSATAGSSAFLIKQDQKPVSASSTNTTSMVKQDQKPVAGSATGTASVIKQTGKALSAASAASALLKKLISKTLSATSTVTATISSLKVRLLSLIATCSSSASVLKSTGKALSAASTSAGNLSKSAVKTLSTTCASIATSLAQKVGGIIALVLVKLSGGTDSVSSGTADDDIDKDGGVA